MITGNKKNHSENNSLVNLRVICILAMFGIMLIAPSVAEGKIDPFSKDNNKAKNKLSKAIKNNSLNSNPNEENIKQNVINEDSCDQEKPCFLNVVIKYKNQIIKSENLVNDNEISYYNFEVSRTPNTYQEEQVSYESEKQSDILKLKISKLEEKLNKINSRNNFVDIRLISSHIVELKNINNEILEIYSENNFKEIDNVQATSNLSELEKKYLNTIKKLKTNINDYQKDNYLPISKKLLINQLMKESLVLNNKINEFEIKEKIKESIKKGTEIKETKKQYKKLLFNVAIEHDDKYGYYDNDEIILDVIKKSIDLDLLKITNHALDELYNRQSDLNTKAKISDLKKLVINEIKNNEEKGPQNNLFLLSKEFSVPSSKIAENQHEITNYGILK